MKEEVDEIRILANWMYSHRRQTETIYWSPEQSSADFSHRIVRFLEVLGLDEGESREGLSVGEDIPARIAS